MTTASSVHPQPHQEYSSRPSAAPICVYFICTGLSAFIFTYTLYSLECLFLYQRKTPLPSAPDPFDSFPSVLVLTHSIQPFYRRYKIWQKKVVGKIKLKEVGCQPHTETLFCSRTRRKTLTRKCKMSSSKKIYLKRDFAAGVFLPEASSPPMTLNPPPPYILYIRVYSIRGEGRANQRKGQRGNSLQSWVENTNTTNCISILQSLNS